VDEIMQRQKMLEDSATKEKRSFLDRLLKRWLINGKIK
jgi:hypothetical protein